MFPRPVVAAATGHALAAGAILLLASDSRIGARGDFKIGLNEVSIGMVLPVFGVELARARLSKRHFSSAVSRARIYDPDSAVDAGFLDRVATADALFDNALVDAQQLAGLAHPAFFETKKRERQATVQFIRDTLEADINAISGAS
jgi:enoyl-CoA hydratase